MISVIIPTYNSSDYIVDCLNSILSQTYKDWEIIVVDDASEDNTQITVEQYVNNNNLNGCLKYYRNESKRGVSAARNIGIKASKRKFVSFLDSDDIWYPQKLEKVMDVFRDFPEVDLVCHNEYTTINGKIANNMEYSKKVVGLDLKNKTSLYKKLISDNFLSASAVTTKRICLENELFDETLIVAEDYDLWLRLARKYQFFFLPEFLGEFRKINADSLSTNLYQRFKGLLQVTKKNKSYVGTTAFYVKSLRCYLFLLKNWLLQRW
ncbi:MAG: glycosyltransferase family 2 protein [Planctomycetota bacterium]|jgi:glycosyltransferase involved in cell wall biosynthesis